MACRGTTQGSFFWGYGGKNVPVVVSALPDEHALPGTLVACMVALAATLAAVAGPNAVYAQPPLWQPHRTDGLGYEIRDRRQNGAAEPAKLASLVQPGDSDGSLWGEAVMSFAAADATVVGSEAGQIANGYGAPVGGGAWGEVAVYDGAAGDSRLWRWHTLPSGLVYPSYWAGVHESRLSGVVFRGADGVSFLDVSLGGRAALLRYGSSGGIRPQGWELAMEGGAFPRLNLDENWDVDAVDFRFGVPLTYGEDNWQWKFAFYHLSAHMGDEFALREGLLSQRINFSRDVWVAGVSYYPLPAWRFYAETGFAGHYDGGADPWEFQFGVDVAAPGPTGSAGTPFAAVNGHLREEHNYGGNLVVQFGWLWRGESADVFRVGFHYYNGKTNQFEFFDHSEQQVGAGIWYDF